MACGMRPSAALTSLGLTAAACTSTTAWPGGGSGRSTSTICGASASALAALPVSTSLRPLACCFINGVLWLRGASALVRRRQVPQLPRLCGARELSAEVLDDAACLGDEIGVAAGELGLAEVDRVFEANAHMAAQHIGLCHRLERMATDGERGPLRALGQQAA